MKVLGYSLVLFISSHIRLATQWKSPLKISVVALTCSFREWEQVAIDKGELSFLMKVHMRPVCKLWREISASLEHDGEVYATWLIHPCLSILALQHRPKSQTISRMQSFEDIKLAMLNTSIIASRFDAFEGVIHGLSHRQNTTPNCMCPGCLSRRASNPKSEST